LKSVSVTTISETVFYPRLSAITAEIRVLFSCKKTQDYILSAIQQFWFAAAIGTRTNADMADLKYGFYLLRKWRIPGNSGAAQAQSADFTC
jgi:hypothetical protein